MIEGILNPQHNVITVTLIKHNLIIFEKLYRFNETIDIKINPKYVKQGSHYMKLQANRLIENPCYLRGFVNKSTIGVGNFYGCYELLKKKTKLNNIDLFQLYNNTTQLINIEDFTYNTVKEKIRLKCESEYGEDLDFDLCEKLTLFILTIDLFKEGNEKSSIFHSAKEYQIIATFTEYNEQSEVLIYTIILFTLYILSYIYKNEAMDYIESKFSKEKGSAEMPGPFSFHGCVAR